MYAECSGRHAWRRLRAATLALLALGLAVLALAGGAAGAGALPAQATTGTGEATTATSEATTTTASPATSASTTTAPPATQPPATAPGATTATTAFVPSTAAADAPGASGDPDDGGRDSVDWGLVAVVAAVVVAIAALLVVIGRTLARGGHDREELGRHVAHLVAGARWVHDQGSLGVLSRTPSPDRLRAEWGDTRRRVNDLAAEASEVAITAPGDMSIELRHLAGALNQLESAIDQHVDLRLQATGDGDTLVIDESALAVDERRHELDAAIAPLAARI